jgi:ketosteroid isomerase-like protein
MSQENVEIVRAALEAWNREDWDATFQDAPPGFELDASRAVGPMHGVFKLDEFRRVLVEFAESWESVRVEPHEFIEAGDRVVVPWTMHVRGREGIEAAARVAVVWTTTEQSSAFPCTRSGRRPSKPWACRSKTLIGQPLLKAPSA